MVEHVSRQTVGLPAEQQRISGVILHLAVEPLAGRSERKDSRGRTLREELRKAVVVHHVGVLSIVKTRSAQPSIVEFETEWVNQVQTRVRIHAEAHQVAGVRWNLGSVQHNAEHGASLRLYCHSVPSPAVTAGTPALFTRDSSFFVPTEYTRTRWVSDAQHGGPPCGLLAHTVEQVPSDQPMQVTRITFDLMRVVPMTPLSVATEVVRSGRRVQVIVSSLLSDGIEVARATALRIRTTEIQLPPSPLEPSQPITPPDGTPGAVWERWERGGDLTRFHRNAIEVRTIGESFWTPGRGLSWIKLLYPVVEGETLTPLTRTATLADVANGNSMTLDPSEYLFVNPDMTLYLQRPLIGDWLGMDSIARQHSTGVGVIDTLLFDEVGLISRVNQAQLLEVRTEADQSPRP